MQSGRLCRIVVNVFVGRCGWGRVPAKRTLVRHSPGWEYARGSEGRETSNDEVIPYWLEPCAVRCGALNGVIAPASITCAEPVM